MNIQKLSLLALAGVLSGCASAVVKEDHLVRKTELALGMERSAFTISDRVDEGLQTSYTVKTQAGKKFSCYVEGSFSFGTGSVVTDAICSELGKAAKSKNSKGAPCDALSKAAGKC
jgi:hypothetical protein